MRNFLCCYYRWLIASLALEKCKKRMQSSINYSGTWFLSYSISWWIPSLFSISKNNLHWLRTKTFSRAKGTCYVNPWYYYATIRSEYRGVTYTESSLHRGSRRSGSSTNRLLQAFVKFRPLHRIRLWNFKRLMPKHVIFRITFRLNSVMVLLPNVGFAVASVADLLTRKIYTTLHRAQTGRL